MLNSIKFASLFFLEKCLCRSDDVLSIKNGVSVRLFTDTGKYTLTFWCLIRINLPIFDGIHIFSQKILSPKVSASASMKVIDHKNVLPQVRNSISFYL